MQISYQPFIRKHSSLANWYYTWLASNRLLQIHDYKLELKSRTSFDFLAQGGGEDRGSFEHQKHMIKLMYKKIIAILLKLVFLNWLFVVKSNKRQDSETLV